MQQRHLVKRCWLWVKIRLQLHRLLMNSTGAVSFLKYQQKTSQDRDVLRFISIRQCTAARMEQCIVARPKDPNDWCSRCLALDHLIATEKEQ